VLIFIIAFGYLKWNTQTVVGKVNKDLDKKFDSIYNITNGFKNDIEFLTRSMSFKINRAKKTINNHNFKGVEDVNIAKNIMDTLKKHLNEDERNINKIVIKDKTLRDSISIFSDIEMNNIHLIKLSDGKEPFISILDKLQEKTTDFKKLTMSKLNR
jgi:hypothetical protein